MNYCLTAEGGKYRVCRLVNGLYKLPVGPTFERPIDAARYADFLTNAPTTPGGGEPDPADGFWGALDSGDVDRRHRGSSDANLSPRRPASSG